MTKAKKVLSLVLAVVMVAAMFTFSAGAVASQKATLTVTPSATTAQIGDVITVTVGLTTDYYAAATSVPVYYNPAVFEFVAGSVVDVAKMFGATATDMQSYNDATAGCLKVAFIPQSANGATAKTLNGTLFTFQLKAIANGDSTVEVKAADQKTSTNVGGTLYCGAYATSSVSSAVDMYDQTFAITNTTVTVGAAAAPELQLTAYGEENGAVIVKTENYAGFVGCVMGIDTANAESFADYLTTPAGSYEILPNEEGNDAGTGVVINLLDADGTVVESYVFILFGDVNGDGFYDSGDAGLISEAEVGLSEFAHDYCELAADFDGSGYYDSADASYISEYEVGLYETSQAAIAAEALIYYSF